MIQIIFFGFFLFAANRASQGEIQDRVAILAKRFGIVTVTRFFNATSKLVAIADLDRVQSASETGKSIEAFKNTTKMLEGLNQEDVQWLANMDKEQRRDLARMIAALSPADRENLARFIGRYGIGFVRATVAKGLDAEQVRRFVAAIAKLPPPDRKKFTELGVAFVKASPDKRKKIVDAAATVMKPMCFSDQKALWISEVAGGYIVRPIIGDVLSDVARYLSPGAHLGAEYRLGEGDFERFSAAISGAHPTCFIKVRQDSSTNSEAQFKTIQRWYITF
ncbi:MAG TPA: hypothetical protein VGC72_06485 [Candidatus Elarobacter sp.]